MCAVVEPQNGAFSGGQLGSGWLLLIARSCRLPSLLKSAAASVAKPSVDGGVMIAGTAKAPLPFPHQTSALLPSEFAISIKPSASKSPTTPLAELPDILRIWPEANVPEPLLMRISICLPSNAARSTLPSRLKSPAAKENTGNDVTGAVSVRKVPSRLLRRRVLALPLPRAIRISGQPSPLISTASAGPELGMEYLIKVPKPP